MGGCTTESIVLAVAPKVPALLSLGGSMYIVWSVLSRREKKNSIYQRLMLCLSLSDILASHIYFLGTWLIPKGSSGPFGDVYMAFGTDATCSYSGFFNQLAIASPLYNVSLSMYYLLRIQRGWRNDALKKIEPLFHLIPLAFALGTAITAAVGEMYGNVFWTCWINPDPPQPYFRYFQWSFLFGPVWICIIIQLVVMTSLWWTMRKQERLISKKYALEESTTSSSLQVKMGDSTEIDTKPDLAKDADEESRDSTNSSLDGSSRSNGGLVSRRVKARRRSIINEGKYSTRIAVQGSLYVLAFCICWFFPTVQRITELAHGTNYFAVQALDTTLLPLQGFFNVLIYLRPRYMNYRRKYPDLPTTTILHLIHHPKDERSLVQEFREKAAVQKKSEDSGASISSSDFRSNSGDEALSRIPEERESGSLVHVSVSFSIEGGVSKKVAESDDEETKESEDTGRRIDSINATAAAVETSSSSATGRTAATNNRDNKNSDVQSSHSTEIKRIDMGGRIQTSTVASSSEQ